METACGAFGDQVHQNGSGIRRVATAARKTEFVLLPQLLEILQALNQRKNFRPGGFVFRVRFSFASQTGHRFGKIAVATLNRLVWQSLNNLQQKLAYLFSDPQATN